MLLILPSLCVTGMYGHPHEPMHVHCTCTYVNVCGDGHMYMRVCVLHANAYLC